MTMLTRGPRQRRKSLEVTPEILKSVVADVQGEIEEWINDGADPELAAARMKELREVQERFSKGIPSQVIEMIRTPYWSEHGRMHSQHALAHSSGTSGHMLCHLRHSGTFVWLLRRRDACVRANLHNLERFRSRWRASTMLGNRF